MAAGGHMIVTRCKVTGAGSKEMAGKNNGMASGHKDMAA